MNVPHIPILRRGQVYESLDVQTVSNVAGTQAACEVSFACADMIKHDLLEITKARKALQGFRCTDLVKICQHAADLFLTDTLPVGSRGFCSRRRTTCASWR